MNRTITTLLFTALLSITFTFGHTTPKNDKNNAKTPEKTVAFYPSTQKEGFIGASEDHPFEKPAWLGKEVTGDAKYYNSMLMKNPFKSW